MLRQSRLLLGVAVAGVLASALGSAILIAGQFFRGFDMSDEAFVYSLSLAGGSLERGWFFSYAYLVSPVFDLFGQQVWPMRVLRYLAYLLVSLALAGAVIGVLQKLTRRSMGGWAHAGVIAAAFLGLLWAWTYLPPVISYNELTVWFVSLIAAALLIAESNWISSKPIWVFAAIGLIAGTFQGLLLLAKLPSAIGIAGLVVAYVFLLRKFATNWLAFFGGYLVGAGLVSLVLTLAGIPVSQVVGDGFRAVATGEGAPAGYDTTGRLGEYLITVQDGLITLRGPIALLLVAVVAIYLFGKSPEASRLPRVLVMALVGGVTVLSLFWAWHLGVGQGGADSPFEIGFGLIYLSAIGVVMSALALSQGRSFSLPLLLRCVILLLAIVGIAVVGTSNPITFQANLIATPLLLIAAMCGVVWWQMAPGGVVDPRPAFGLFASLTIVAIAGLTFTLVWQGTWLNPYRQPPLANQKSTIQSGILRSVTTSYNTAAAATELPKIAEELGLKATATTAWDNPGLVLFFNNSQFASSWQLPYVPTSTEELFRACAASPQALVVLDDMSAARRERGGDPKFFFEAVSSCGAKYPTDYQMVKTLAQLPPGFDIEVQVPRAQ